MIRAVLVALALTLASACGFAETRVPPSPEPAQLRGIVVSLDVALAPEHETTRRYLSENGFDHLVVDVPPAGDATAALFGEAKRLGLGLVVGLAGDAGPG